MNKVTQIKKIEAIELKNKNKIKLGVPTSEGQLSIMFTRGGSREGAGRKSIGETRKISLTLPQEIWEKLEERCSSKGGSRSEVIREIIESYFSK